MYLLEAGKRRYIPSIQVFLSWGYRWEQIVTISQPQLENYPLDIPLSAQKHFSLEGDFETINTTLGPRRVLSGPFFAKFPRLVHQFAHKVTVNSFVAKKNKTGTISEMPSNIVDSSGEIL